MSDVIYALLMLLLLAALPCSRRASVRHRRSRAVGRRGRRRSRRGQGRPCRGTGDDPNFSLSVLWKVAADDTLASLRPSGAAKAGERKGEDARALSRGEERWREFRKVLDARPGGQMAGGNGSPDAKATPKRITSTQMSRRVPRGIILVGQFLAGATSQSIAARRCSLWRYV